MLQLNTMISSMCPKNMIHAACHRKHVQNAMLQLNAMISSLCPKKLDLCCMSWQKCTKCHAAGEYHDVEHVS